MGRAAEENAMEKWKENFLSLVKNKLYMLALSFTAAGGYGFLVTHQTVGIDDTPYAYYFEEGLNAIVGRWFLFLLNKIFHISDFTPFLTDLAGVLILMLGVTVWCALLRSICGERVPLWGYVFFSCIFSDILLCGAQRQNRRPLHTGRQKRLFLPVTHPRQTGCLTDRDRFLPVFPDRWRRAYMDSSYNNKEKNSIRRQY